MLNKTALSVQIIICTVLAFFFLLTGHPLFLLYEVFFGLLMLILLRKIDH
ncbi:hypothetical protein NZD89_04370 [Alicyclobacillus fastidiosus]|uniref:Uncharacterized protein n=1 Tax=Alicyclobacillus fastidiosus TaxID=392011 RepID=A0ABY6ZJL5_9BACL|nr:hypothetical protein [Alicyclobacillus fastidiosus]WAH42682.1 hypothetical protein NZD89_04370 [Alicyclobacillus fastidiosus]